MSLTLIFATAAVAVTIAAVLVVHAGTRRIMDHTPDARTSELAGFVLFRVSALHGLVLALVFASEVVEHQQIAQETTSEANAVADIFFDIARFGPADTPAIQEAAVSYLQLASGQEWEHLGHTGRLLPEAWAQWDRIYGAVLDLAPGTPRQISLRDNMLDRIHLVAQVRDRRAHHAAQRPNSLFWFAALVGVVLIAATYYGYPPSRDNLILMAVFAGYTGLILFVIFALSSPFRPPGQMAPDALLTELAQLEAARAAANPGG